MLKDIKYIKEESSDFSSVLKKRVSQYFKETQTERYANGQMVVKTIFMFCLFFLPMLTIIFIDIDAWMLFALYMLAGLGKTGLGMGVMHDANHGSYSKKSLINKLLGYTLNFIGGNSQMWKLQHNVLHHTFTNVDQVDEDLNAPFFLRFSPHTKRNRLHRFQHIYAWFFYGLSTIPWAISKDFISLAKYNKMGLLRDKDNINRILFDIVLWKIIYFGIVLILPIVFSSFPVWMILLAFFCQHFVTGLSLTLVFQLAHVVPSTQYPLPNGKGVINEDWSIHQMNTTCNFAPKSTILSWLIGGLNYQIEHHLFPNICHVHYKELSPIVKQTAKEFGVPYLCEDTFLMAVKSHFMMLKGLGRG